MFMHAVFAVVTATTYRVTVIGNFFSLEGYDGADMVGLVGFCCAGECA